MIRSVNGKTPVIAESAFVSEAAYVVGDVEIDENSSVWPGAVIRGDFGKIKIGRNSAVEDNCVIHARPNEECSIGKNVTIGHGSIIHNAKISDWAIIGMNAVVSDYSEVGEWAVVAEGCVVKNNQKIPSGKVAVGIPAQIITDVTDQYKEQWIKFKGKYVTFAKNVYREKLKKINE